MLINFTRLIKKSQKLTLFKYIQKRIESLGSDSKRQLKPATEKTNNIYNHEVIVLLRMMYLIVQNLGSGIFEIIAKPNDLFTMLNSFIQSPTYSIKLLACQIIKAFSDTNPKWNSNLLSLILNIITILHAEFEGTKQIGPDNDSNLADIISGLHGHSLCLSILLRDMDFNQYSIPFDIANSIFETSRSKIL